MNRKIRWLGTLAGLLLIASPGMGLPPAKADLEIHRRFTAAQVPVERFPEPHRSQVIELLNVAPLFQRGPIECFPCRMGLYEWLLDHPEVGMAAWRAMGATQAKLERLPDGRWRGTDPAGGEVHCTLVLSEPGRRLWLVEGSVRPLPFLPVMTLKALVVLRYQDVVGAEGRTGVRHRAEVFADVDMKSAGWLAKLTGITAETASHKALEQVELFFSGMAWYICENPHWAERTLPPTLSKPEQGKSRQVLLEELKQLRAAKAAAVLDLPTAPGR